MHLVSLERQTVRVLGQTFSFAKGERIHTENSHKYSVEEFQALARSAGWTPAHAWTDQDQLFSLHLLRPGLTAFGLPACGPPGHGAAERASRVTFHV